MKARGTDNHDNAQDIDKDFFSGILRIDVDQRPGNLSPNPHPSTPDTSLSHGTTRSSVLRPLMGTR